jgi:predicted Zn-dependent protease
MLRWLTTGVVVAAAALGWFGVAAPRRAEARASAERRAELAYAAQVRDADITFWSRRAVEDPASAADRAQLAGLYLQRARERGDWDDYHRAEAAAREAITLRAGRNGKAYLVLASSLLARHEFAAARAVADTLVARWPDEPAYRALLAELHVELGDDSAARAAFAALGPHLDHPAVAPRWARWLELTGDPRGAERVLQAAHAAARAEPSLPAEQRAWFALRVGDFLLRQGRIADGERVLRDALRETPDDGRLGVALARAAALRGDPRAALDVVATHRAAADIATLALAGDAAQALGDTAAAREWWDAAEAAAVARPEPYNRQWTLFRLEHGIAVPETRALLERELALRRDVAGWDQVALARLLTGDVSGAEVAVREALRLGTRDAGLQWRAAQVAFAAGRHTAARAHLDSALTRNPRFHPRATAWTRALRDSLVAVH